MSPYVCAGARRRCPGLPGAAAPGPPIRPGRPRPQAPDGLNETAGRDVRGSPPAAPPAAPCPRSPPAGAESVP
ncbi:hypothetical protein CP976_26405 [Streptomyces coeruleorubidus]|uniref:Uncharacterized protein n=1 Tax=Streptomyces coeruleorubidus TaxID=116188 RepID=A0A5J6I4D3_STRC4|nr:hypothetical protein CP976_26405 [Streptomyces coeruleorubidus]